MKKTVKGIPIILVAVLTISLVAVGATLYSLYISQQFTTSIDVRGMDALTMQADYWQAYINRIPATTLADQYSGPGDSTLIASDCVLLVIDNHGLTNENVIMTIEIIKPDQTPFEGGWTATPRFVQFSRSGGDGIVYENSVLSTGQGSWMITQADLAKMDYYPGAFDTPLPSGSWNCMIIEFDIVDMGYAESGEVWGSYDVDIQITLSVDA